MFFSFRTRPFEKGITFEGCGADFTVVLVVEDRTNPIVKYLHHMLSSGRLLSYSASLRKEDALSLCISFYFSHQNYPRGYKLARGGVWGIF